MRGEHNNTQNPLYHQPLTQVRGSCLQADDESHAAHSLEECDKALSLVADRNCFEVRHGSMLVQRIHVHNL